MYFRGLCPKGRSMTYDDVYEMVNGHPRTKPERKRAAPIDDPDWASRQQAFPHTVPMPKLLKNHCPSCTDVVGPRVTKGVYLPVEHDCPRTRVYDLHGKLL